MSRRFRSNDPKEDSLAKLPSGCCLLGLHKQDLTSINGLKKLALKHTLGQNLVLSFGIETQKFGLPYSVYVDPYRTLTAA